jgi:hypothetical protein
VSAPSRRVDLSCSNHQGSEERSRAGVRILAASIVWAALFLHQAKGGCAGNCCHQAIALITYWLNCQGPTLFAH